MSMTQTQTARAPATIEAELQQATRLCEKVLRVDPAQQDALHLIGMLSYRQGRSQAATEAIQRAMSAVEDDAGCSDDRSDRRSLDQAVRVYRESVEQDPRSAEVYFALGEHQLEAGQAAAAIESFQQAFRIDANWTAACEKLAECCWLCGQIERAIQLLQPLAAADTPQVQNWQVLADCYLKIGALEQASDCFQSALEHDAGNAELHYQLGRVHLLRRQLQSADRCFQQVLTLDVDHQAAWHDRGAVLLNLGQVEAARQHFLETLAREPQHADALCNLGLIHLLANELDESASFCERALQVNPSHACTRNILGNVYRARGQLTAAVSEFQQALQLNAAYTEAHNNLALSYHTQGRMDEAVAHYKRAMEQRTHCAATHSNYLLSRHYLPDNDLDEHFREHMNWAEAHGGGARRTQFSNSRDPRRKLRIGYVSPDFRRHPVGSFIAPILEHHDPMQFETICYSGATAPDDQTALLEQLSQRWRVTNWLDDEALIAQIVHDEVDVLIDLAGHTAGNRLTAFAAKPAPIQVTYLGYGSTTGLDAVDYRITDDCADPAGEPLRHTEQLLRLSCGLLCFVPPDDSPDVSPTPALTNGCVTFGIFNNPAKINHETIAVWAEILTKIPESRLILKYPTYSDSGTCEHFKESFAGAGIDTKRIEFRGGHLPVSRHLAAHGDIDVMLDTFPYTGSTTTCESLWMGVPVLTLRGESFVGRISSSILTQLNLPELIAENRDQYVHTAVELAGNVQQLAAARMQLRDVMQRSPLCDAAGYTAELEAVFREIWRRWCVGES